MKLKEMQSLTKQELIEKIESSRKQLMELQFKRGARVEKPHIFKKTRKDIARMFTILREK